MTEKSSADNPDKVGYEGKFKRILGNIRKMGICDACDFPKKDDCVECRKDLRVATEKLKNILLAEGERRVKESQDYINSEAWCENELEEAREEGYNEAVDNLGKDLMEGKGKCDEALMKLIESQKEKYQAEGRKQALKEVDEIIGRMEKEKTIETDYYGSRPIYFYSRKTTDELKQAIDQLRNKGE